MNPWASRSGGSGLSTSSSAAAKSGDAFGRSATGEKIITFGGNPNNAAGIAQNPVFLIAVVAAVFLLVR